MTKPKKLTFNFPSPEDGVVLIIDKINEIIDCLPDEDKYPVREGEKEMYAVMGTGGGIFGFARSKREAEKVRDNCWNIGKRKPEKYIVSFRKV